MIATENDNIQHVQGLNMQVFHTSCFIAELHVHLIYLLLIDAITLYLHS